MELSDAEKRLLRQLEEAEENKRRLAQEKVANNATYLAIEQECHEIARFLKDRVKLRPTLLIEHIPRADRILEADTPVAYCLGKDLHYTVITHRTELL
jgi:hypothetical protein